jgi:acetyl esterase/lipase
VTADVSFTDDMREIGRKLRFMPGDNGFHPELRTMARFLPRTALSPRTLRIMRALERLPIGVKRDVEVLTLTSGLNVRLHRPLRKDGPPAALLWIHGGGYVIGRPHQSDEFCQRLSRKLGITVAAPSYRLAPEHPYPAALEDCYAALRWLVRCHPSIPREWRSLVRAAVAD